MQISVKLMGLLRDKTPPDGKLELPAGATVADALRALEISLDNFHVITVNDQLERNCDRVLTDGDDLAVLPPVGGG